jgi:hypothetical protein
VSAAIILAGMGGMVSVTLILLRFPVIWSYRSGAADGGSEDETPRRDTTGLRPQPTK